MVAGCQMNYMSLFATNAADRGKEKCKKTKVQKNYNSLRHAVVINSISKWSCPIITQISISKINTDVILQVSDFNKIGSICRFTPYIRMINISTICSCEHVHVRISSCLYIAYCVNCKTTTRRPFRRNAVLFRTFTTNNCTTTVL